MVFIVGITIAGLTGKNGLINNTEEAKKQTEIANEKEILERATAGAMAQDSRGNIKKENLQNKLNNETGEGKTEVSDVGEEFEVLFTDSNRYYAIDKNGNIGNAEDGNTLMNEMTTGTGFKPIGRVENYNYFYFKGNFDGENNSINNLYKNGFFGYITSAEIKNIKLYSQSKNRCALVNEARGM